MNIHYQVQLLYVWLISLRTLLKVFTTRYLAYGLDISCACEEVTMWFV
jgi:hypothetical protein